MTISLLVILGLCSIEVIAILWLIFRNHHSISRMHGMVLAMALGMGVGLLIGTILGAMLHGNLYVSTIYSILIGLSIGFIAGIPFHISAVIDGSLAGLMGGMMGAMLGEMIMMTSSEATIKLLSFFITMIFLLVIYTIEESTEKKHSMLSPFSILKHKYLLLFIITIIFIGLKYLGPVTA
ncbi:hypothetical protein GMD78_13960 [Ornithinibacillus sp. L9]|uniref:Uncharacterized protein n=1 Tax=Ornithinibacillus caprae TaxID=2678566 RepID=A0A6N8FPQ1_9BACI|nr:hypothetical protein [Ornithinibacillus caprae]MUK89468.1 hypothetical protein [Ornithinibacillus caprae]